MFTFRLSSGIILCSRIEILVKNTIAFSSTSFMNLISNGIQISLNLFLRCLGFMKKALQEVLESDVNYCSDNSPARSPLEIRKFPDTRQSEAASVSTANNGEANCDADKKSDEDSDKPLDGEMGNIENKSRNNSLLENGETDGKVQSKRFVSESIIYRSSEISLL